MVLDETECYVEESHKRFGQTQRSEVNMVKSMFVQTFTSLWMDKFLSNVLQMLTLMRKSCLEEFIGVVRPRGQRS